MAKATELYKSEVIELDRLGKSSRAIAAELARKYQVSEPPISHQTIWRMVKQSKNQSKEVTPRSPKRVCPANAARVQRMTQ
jgi:hypothetical protein